jgi:hypothetical protein
LIVEVFMGRLAGWMTELLHLPPMPGHGSPRVKNGPPLAGRGAEAVRDAITAQITTLPEQLRRSLTWDQGAGAVLNDPIHRPCRQEVPLTH